MAFKLRRSRSTSSTRSSSKRVPTSYSSKAPITPDGTTSSQPTSPKLTLQNPERELYININCPIRLLMEYIRNEANIPEKLDFDLFDEMGNLKLTFHVPAQRTASEIFIPKGVYFIVLLPRTTSEKEGGGTFLKPQVLINRGARLNADYITRIRRQLQSNKKHYSAEASNRSKRGL